MLVKPGITMESFTRIRPNQINFVDISALLSIPAPQVNRQNVWKVKQVHIVTFFSRIIIFINSKEFLSHLFSLYFKKDQRLFHLP